MDELEARRRRRAPQAGAEDDVPAGDNAGQNELLGRLEASRRRRRAAEDRLAAAEEDARAARQEAVSLAARVDSLQAQVEIREGELEAARRSLTRELERVRAERSGHERLAVQAAEQLEAERERVRVSERRVRHTRKLVDRLKAEAQEGREHRAFEQERRAAEIAEVTDAIRRTARSRSWRLGHGIMKVLRRLTFRPAVTRQDPLESAADELDRISGGRELEPGD